ncbi:30S ribosomal protein S19 [Candidatus Micrarchaeota archaeon]|nr:30S ribosomal protein S19 [Candidatus Micrarchaeota archaeon]MBU1930733.1 30S ribosomal protein S19 [Candidatus Micrarchaeota archaeon]
MAKTFLFRGKTLEELQGMRLEEFAKLCRSRQKRSLLRGFNKPLLKRIEKAAEAQKTGKEPKPVRTHRRSAIVIPKMVGLQFAVYRGNSFETVEIKPIMLGHYLGELVLTRKRLLHGKAGIGATRSSTAISQRG